MRILLLIPAVLLAVACNSPQGPSLSSGGESGTKVNRLVFAVAPPVLESNQLRMIGQTAMWQVTPMYEYLIGMDAATGQYVPQLATEWSVRPDGSAINFKLRKGVQFQQGYGEMTAKDVVHSWHDLVQPDATAGYQVQLARQSIDTVEPVNDYEVNIKISQKNSDLLNMISQAQGGFEIMSKAHFDKAGDPNLTTPAIAGTGPYQMQSRQQGVNIVYERVPYQHWRTTPDFPEFEFRWIKEPSTALAALLANEVHMTSLPNDLMPQAETQGFKVVSGKVKALRTYLSFWCCFLKNGQYTSNSSPLHDVRVRKALSKAIDRNALNKAFFAGKGQVIYGTNFLPDEHPAFNPQWKADFDKEYGFDQAAARQLLADAGFGPGNPLKSTLFVHPLAQYSGAPDVAEALGQAWRAVGADITLQNIDPTEMQTASRMCKWENHMDIIGTSGAPLGPFGYYNSSFIGNCGGHQSTETDALYKKLLDELDVDKHTPLFKDLGDASYRLHNNIPLFWLPAEAMVNPKVVSDWVWPGSISGTWTHIETIKAVK